MKKILFIFIICISIISCNYTNNSNNYDNEFIEYAKSFNLLENIDTVNLEHIKAKAFQIFGTNECLARELSNEKYEWYHGNIIYIITDQMLYDNIIFDDDFVFLGTYKYISRDSVDRTVKLYSDIYVYKENIDFFNSIKDININGNI